MLPENHRSKRFFAKEQMKARGMKVRTLSSR